MTQVQYRRADRAIVAYGYFPDFDPDDPDVGMVEVADDTPLGEAGAKYLEEGGNVRVVPPRPEDTAPPPLPPDPLAAQVAALEARLAALEANVPGKRGG